MNLAFRKAFLGSKLLFNIHNLKALQLLMFFYEFEYY